jgi:Rrf2 family iron-sulfur cluster assembly transcriptional regulator
MVDLALHQERGPVPRKEIAERQGISIHYLAQLFVKLKRAGLVESVLGREGGYALARSATEISAGDVLRAVGESLTPVYCVDDGPDAVCHRMEGCPGRPLWLRLGEAIAHVLDSFTLADLCKRSRELTGEKRQRTERR